MVLWISAIRRCSVSAPGRPVQSMIAAEGGRPAALSEGAAAGTGTDGAAGGEGVASEAVRLRLSRQNVLHANSWRNPEAEIKLIDFLKHNRACAECRSQELLK